MTTDEQRKILEDIARNEDNYPRDRIAAVRALRELAPAGADDFEDELVALAGRKPGTFRE